MPMLNQLILLIRVQCSSECARTPIYARETHFATTFQLCIKVKKKKKKKQA